MGLVLMGAAGGVWQPRGDTSRIWTIIRYYRGGGDTLDARGGWLKAAEVSERDPVNIYDGTYYREGGVRMGNTINYPDGGWSL